MPLKRLFLHAPRSTQDDVWAELDRGLADLRAEERRAAIITDQVSVLAEQRPLRPGKVVPTESGAPWTFTYETANGLTLTHTRKFDKAYEAKAFMRAFVAQHQ
jgi:hypothetical protein